MSLYLGFVDEITESIEDAVSAADLIVLSVPVGAMAAIAEIIGPK